jgi:hypothetical protein
MLLDPSVRHQVYIEDCEVCCNPIQIRIGFEANTIVQFNAVSIEQ